MADQDNKTNQQGQGGNQSGTNQAGDPGTTPGSAEGDEQTVDESLRQKENAGK